MKDFSLSIQEYRARRIKNDKRAFGFADLEAIEESVRRYATARKQYKLQLIARSKGEDFNPFTDDPNCKSCRKKKR